MRHLRHRFGKRWSLVLVACLLLTLAVPLTPARAAMRVVTKLTDDNTAGTLRKEIADAASGDTIAFAVTGIITVGSAITLDKDLTIQGPGAATFIVSGGGKVPVFSVPKGTVTFSGMTISGGKGSRGGGVAVEQPATVTLTNTTVTGNTAAEGGGIHNRGTVKVTSSTVTNNTSGAGGGGIYNSGTATVESSTVSGNTAETGGGLRNDRTMKVTNSTISGNKAGSLGGAIENNGGTLTATNSTISGNTATSEGGGISNSGTVNARNLTIANNTAGEVGGGINTISSTMDFSNLLITGNTVSAANSASDLDIRFGTDTNSMSRGNNFIRSVAFTAGSARGLPGTFAAKPSDILRNEAVVLGPLADNGGPTQTHALLPGSAPVDKGNADTCADPNVDKKDQRGATRPQGAACDIGAYESGGSPPPVMTPAMGTVPVPAMAPAMAPAMMNPPVAMMPAMMNPAMAPAMAMNPVVLPAMNPAMAMACAPFAPGSPFAFAAFQSQWQGGEALAPNFWGPSVSAALMEPYQETGGQRLVQYFDKGRMERGASDTVTNGLLANELITGQMQVGDNAFMARGAAAIPVAGDPDNAGPTYAGLGAKAGGLFAAAPNRSGAAVTATVAADGTVAAGAMTTGGGATAISAYDMTTQHNVPQAFAEYRARAGVSSIGLAKSEPFLTTVKVGGQPKEVMVQVFERRVLTYTAANDPAFQVEMGNIGQHYYRWRYCGA